jgi:hypothetical protein
MTAATRNTGYRVVVVSGGAVGRAAAAAALA